MPNCKLRPLNCLLQLAPRTNRSDSYNGLLSKAFFNSAFNLRCLTTVANSSICTLTPKSQRFISTSSWLGKFVPDKSKVPNLNENDLEEQFVQGSGPGGQNVNRLQNCVVLRHIPTGIVVKCHQERLMQRNRKLARELLVDRLDQYYNGADSVAEQKKRYILNRKIDREKKAAELRTLKQQYQESLKHKSATHNQQFIEQHDS